MLEKLCWVMLYGVRGSIYAIPLMLLSLAFTFINNNLLSPTEGSYFVFITNYLSNGLMYLSLGALAAAANAPNERYGIIGQGIYQIGSEESCIEEKLVKDGLGEG